MIVFRSGEFFMWDFGEERARREGREEGLSRTRVIKSYVKGYKGKIQLELTESIDGQIGTRVGKTFQLLASLTPCPMFLKHRNSDMRSWL